MVVSLVATSTPYEFSPHSFFLVPESIMVNVVLSFVESFGDSADGESIRFHTYTLRHDENPEPNSEVV